MVEIFLAYAVFILMAAAPFLVIAAILGAILFGLTALIQGIASARPARMAIGAVVMSAGIATSLLLYHWASTEPDDPDATSAHALVHSAWRHTYLRFVAMRWLLDGTFDRLGQDQPHPDR